MTEWRKNSVAVRMTLEDLTMFSTGDWRRKVDDGGWGDSPSLAVALGLAICILVLGTGILM